MSSENAKKPVVAVAGDGSEFADITELLKKTSEFDVHGFADTEGALRFVESQAVDVAVMSGLPSLVRVRELQPETSRVFVTSHAETLGILNAINSASLFQLIEKPLDTGQLLVAVRSGVERSRLLRDLRLRLDELDSAHDVLKNARKRLIEAFL